MNAWPNRKKALAQALANARTDDRPRYVHKYAGVYWIDRHPPSTTPIAGYAGSDYVVVWPEGNYTTFDPTEGPPHVNPDRK